jgi:menaquinone-specific isochorismate synthase
MNNINLRKIRNQFDSIIKNFDESKISTQKVFSVSLNIKNNFLNLNNQIPIENNPIFFSSENFTAYGFIKEKVYSFYNNSDYEKNKNKILSNISNTLFINDDKKCKTFIFGGFNFDLNNQNSKIWNTIPIANFTLPRYIFLSSKLIINIFIDTMPTKKLIIKKVIDYINILEKLSSNPYKDSVDIKPLKLKDLTSKSVYSNNVMNALEVLKNKNSDLIKVVYSRCKQISFQNQVPLINIFKNLELKHKQNMNFLYTIKDDISVIGSTPELILSKHNKEIRSESIAGTNYKNNTDQFILDEKEVLEQEIVTKYIKDFFNLNTKDISYNEKPDIKTSSNVEHLWTYFSAILKNEKSIIQLLDELHPTPAIGGYPKKDAINFIKNTNEDRGWYGGPIGWIDNNLDGQFHLNIRSGLALNSELYLFSGSGITDKSKPDREWAETEQKFNLMIESL